jgi:hypothetical protein
MATHQEEVVDPNLNKFLGENLQTTSARVSVPGQELEEEIEDEVLDMPADEKTKSQIIYYLSRAADNVNIMKLMPLFAQVRGLNKEAADDYLKALKYAHACDIDDSIIDSLLQNAADVFINPNSKVKKEKVVKDKYIRDCVSTGLNDMLGRVGSIAGVAVFAFYVISSWAVKYDGIIEDESKRIENSNNK